MPVPVPLHQQFSYRVSPTQDDAEPQVRIGDLAVVPFGRRKEVIGLITAVTDLAPETTKIDGFALKYVVRILPPEYRVTSDRLKLARWLSRQPSETLGAPSLSPKHAPPPHKVDLNSIANQSRGGYSPRWSALVPPVGQSYNKA